MNNTELIAQSKKVAAELDDFNASLDRKAAKCIRELLEALQLAQPVAPLTDAWIRERTKQPWIFDTVKQWVREIEAAHGIREVK